MKAEQSRQENKHKKQWEELVFRNETSLRELEQLQVYILLFGISGQNKIQNIIILVFCNRVFVKIIKKILKVSVN